MQQSEDPWKGAGCGGSSGVRTLAGSVLGVSTRRLILAALLCGLAILVAFAVQVVLAS
jgi:hypothetical protein